MGGGGQPHAVKEIWKSYINLNLYEWKISICTHKIFICMWKSLTTFSLFLINYLFKSICEIFHKFWSDTQTIMTFSRNIQKLFKREVRKNQSQIRLMHNSFTLLHKINTGRISGREKSTRKKITRIP